MPPHLGVEAVRVGGVPAVLGVIAGLILGWPRADPSTGPFGMTTYHSTLSGSGKSLEAAVGLMVTYTVGFALAGLVVGLILVAMGIANNKDLGMEE